MRAIRVPTPLIDIGLICVAGLDSWYQFHPHRPVSLAFAIVACLALALRRRWPYLVFALALPSLLVGASLLATPIALYTIARRTRDSRPLIGCAAVAVVCYAMPWPLAFTESDVHDMLFQFGYAVALVCGAIFLGQLVQTRQDLRARIVEINNARELERDLLAQSVLATERAQLAREMHDVVSHQVSLIAVRAGALQVGARDPEVEEAANVIRRLSVLTLDELRHMITVLRASGSVAEDRAPQPTIAELDQLVANSGIVTRFDGEPPADIGAPQQRAIYRTVQEALTNVRKHAPGATATIEVWHDDTHFGVTVTNTAASRPALPLPSAEHGLVGLRERAELLGGSVDADPTPDGGFAVRLRLPRAEPVAL